MSSLPKIHRQSRAALGVGLLMFALCSAPVQAASGAALTRTNGGFCLAAQYLLSETTETPSVELQTDFKAFQKSKTSVTPFTIQQFVQYADDESQQPRRISCKLKTADHLQHAFGAQAAGPAQHSCRDLNHLMARNVFAALTEEQRARLQFPLEQIRLEPDLNTVLGSKWVADYQFVWRDADGLHLLAKALHVPYEHWLWRIAPERFRGVYYCHLIAPEYLRALMLGDVSAPNPAAGDS
ncbi:MAG: hypothetical protein IPG25_18080 [Proteobacteria bacterium]|nr:hypothetical protein [Pseudomonadota bacterium]